MILKKNSQKKSLDKPLSMWGHQNVEIISDEDERGNHCSYCNKFYEINSNHNNSNEHKKNLKKFEIVYNFNGFFSVDAQQRDDLLKGGWLSNAVIESYLYCILPSGSIILRKI
jgi:hypothetical protein